MVHSEPIAQSWSVQNKSLQREAELSKMCNRSRPEPISQTGTQGRQMAKRSRCYRLTCAAYKLLQGSWPVCGSGPPELAARNDGGGCAPRNDGLDRAPRNAVWSRHCAPAPSSRGTKRSIAALAKAYGLPRHCAPRTDGGGAARSRPQTKTLPKQRLFKGPSGAA